jgi:Tol biopolymer transport system component
MSTPSRILLALGLFAATVITATQAAVVSFQPAAPLPRSSSTAGGVSFAPVLSPGGRWVVFLSAASDLVGNDDSAPWLDVFAHDLATTHTVLVSVNLSGNGGGNANAHSPSISSNGQFIAFESAADNLIPNDTNGVSDIFVRDLIAGTTTRVSVGAFGPGGTNDASFNPLISHDGRWVVFESRATNLVAGDTNGVADVFLRDLTMGTTVRVSDGVTATGLVYWAAGTPAISPDGRFVAFVKTPTNFPPSPASLGEVFLRDLQAGTTTWVTTNMSNQFPGLSFTCLNPAVSADGRYVAFLAGAQSYYPSAGLYRRDLLPGTNILVLTNASQRAVLKISDDGRFIACAGTPVGGTFAGLHLWDGASGTLRTICADGPGYFPPVCADSPAISADGSVMAYATSNGVFTANPVTLLASGVSLSTNGALRPVTVLSEPSISANGQRVAFESALPDLVADDFNQSSDVFVFDAQTATTRLVSRRHTTLPSATAAGQLGVSRPALSANGRFVAFAAEDKASVSQDVNGARDVLLHDLVLGTSSLIGSGTFVWFTNGMLTTNLLQPKLPARIPVLSADARFSAYEELAIWPTVASVYLNDRAANTWTVVSQQPNGVTVDGAAPAMTGDGRFVAFHSRAAAGAMDGLGTPEWGGLDVFVRDMAATNVQIRTISLDTNGLAGTGESRNPVFSPDGKWIAFQSTSSRLASNTVNGGHQLFARNLVTGKTKLVSYKPNGAGLDLGGTNPVFSADSRYVLFQETNNASATAIYRHDLSSAVRLTNDIACTNCTSPGVSAEGRWVVYETRGTATVQVIVKDMLTGTTNLISVNASGTAGGNGPSIAPQISHDGRYVVFASQASDLVPNDNNGLTDVFIRDRWTGTTLLASINDQGTASGNGPSANPVLAADGRTVAFLSHASDLVPGDFNGQRDLFVLRLGGLDTDGDFMDDDWEMAYFSTLARDGHGDFDNDGMNDLVEFLSGTDPANSGSVFRVLTLTAPSNGNKTLLWSAVPGRTYRVQYASFVGSQIWTDLPIAPVTAVGTTASATDTSAGAATNRFYRVLLQQ